MAVVPHVPAALRVPVLPGSASAVPLAPVPPVSSAAAPREAVSANPAVSASPAVSANPEAASIKTGRQGPPAAASGATSLLATTRPGEHPALVKARSARASAPPVPVHPDSVRIVPAVPPREPASACPGLQASARHALSAPGPPAQARDAALHVPIAPSASRSEIGPQPAHAASTAARRAGTGRRAPRATGPSSGHIPPQALVHPDRALRTALRHPAARSAHSHLDHAPRGPARALKAASAEPAPSARAVSVPADSASPVDGQVLSASPASPSPATGSPRPAEQERASPSSIAPGLIAPNLMAPVLIAPRSTGPNLIGRSPIVPALPVPHSVLASVLSRLPMRLQPPASPAVSVNQPVPASPSADHVLRVQALAGRVPQGQGRVVRPPRQAPASRAVPADSTSRVLVAPPSPALAALANPAAVLRQRVASRVGSSLVASKPAPSVPAAPQHPNASRAARGTKAK
jgi:hypothetical protein